MTTSATLLDAALRYASIGWPVVPLHTPTNGVCDCRDTFRKGALVRPGGVNCSKPGKHPRTEHGLDDATTDEVRIRRWWATFPTANIGVDLKGAGLVDIAPDSLEWQAEFIARGLPPTWSFRSGGGDGHEHHLYTRPASCPAYRSCKPDQYDVMANGYAVMPPSLHLSGQHYAWLSTPATVIIQPEGPEWATGMLQAAYGARSQTNGTTRHVDLSAPSETAPALTGDALARWSGQTAIYKTDGSVDRSLSLWTIGCDLAKAGASIETIVHELHARDEALGWSKYVGRRDSLTRYFVLAERAINGKPPGRLTGRAERILPAEDPPDGLWSKPISALLSQEERPVDWLVEQLFSVGSSGFIAAEPKVGKSWIALELSYCLATGEPFLGRFAIPTAQRVLFIEEEDPERRMLRRFNRLLHGMPGRTGPSDDNYRYVCRSGFRLDDTKWMAKLRVELESFRPAVVVLDVFNKLHLKDENNQSEISAILHDLGSLTREFGAAFLIVHHYRKSGGVGQSSRGNQMLRGTSALAGYAECSLYLRKGKGKGVIVCDPESKDAPELETFEIRMEDTSNDGTRLVAAETPTRVKDAEDEQIALDAVDALARDGTDIEASAVANIAGWDRSKSNRVLNRLVAASKLDVETIGRGRTRFRFYSRPAND